MKKILAAVLTALMLGSLFSGCGVVTNHSDMKVIAVVAKGDDSAFW